MFGEDLSTQISIEEAAKSIAVSSATIRNWIKLGYLTSPNKNCVSRQSLERYINENIGTHKLNRGANKQYKQSNNIALCDPNEWQNYESSLSEAFRNREGIYYTPQEVVEDMFSKIERCDLADKKLLDPCCGSGNFIAAAIEMGFSPQNIYGFDTDPNAVEITKRRVAELSGYRSESIVCADFLEIADSLTIEVDYIFTNPPWGKKIDKKKRDQLAIKYSAGKSTDSSSLFIYAALPLLSDGGKIGFLLQEAFLNIGAYSSLRECLLRLRIDHIIDYGRAFKSLYTKACAIIATKEEHNNRPIECRYMGETTQRTRDSFLHNPQYIFNISASAADSDLLQMLLSAPHTTLKEHAVWGLGIVTGDNKRFCSDQPNGNFKAVYRGSDITPTGFNAPSLYLDPDLTLYQQAAPRTMYEAPCKLVYKFISSRLCFVCDCEQRLILNSANFLILKDTSPISAVELTKFLNSDFTNWVFQRLFSTHKILRGNLSALPIFTHYFNDDMFDEEIYLNHLNIARTESGGYVLRGCDLE